METLQQFRNEERPTDAKCGTCTQVQPSNCLTREGEDFICGYCRIDLARVQKAEAEALQVVDDWLLVRRSRNLLLDKYAWTVATHSPLTENCKDLWMAYLQKLHRVTTDFEDPFSVVWPIQPPLEYAPSPLT